MSRTFECECPSGLTITIREFTVADEDLLADPKAQKKGLAVTALLNAITAGVIDSGPYQFTEADGKHHLDWAQILQGDRMTVLLKNRIFTWGHDLTFRQPCPNCRQSVVTDIDLRDLPVKKLPESSIAHVRDPKTHPLTVTLPHCGKQVSFRLLKGSDDRALQRLQKQHKDTLSSAYLRFRVQEIQDVGQPDLAKWLRNLGGADAAFLRSAFDEADCGIDQEIEFECDSCDHVWIDDVRFRADFLFPKYRGKKQTSA